MCNKYNKQTLTEVIEAYQVLNLSKLTPKENLEQKHVSSQILKNLRGEWG